MNMLLKGQTAVRAVNGAIRCPDRWSSLPSRLDHVRSAFASSQFPQFGISGEHAFQEQSEEVIVEDRRGNTSSLELAVRLRAIYACDRRAHGTLLLIERHFIHGE